MVLAKTGKVLKLLLHEHYFPVFRISKERINKKVAFSCTGYHLYHLIQGGRSGI